MPTSVRFATNTTDCSPDGAELDAWLYDGEQHARQRADRTLARTMTAMGLEQGLPLV